MRRGIIGSVLFKPLLTLDHPYATTSHVGKKQRENASGWARFDVRGAEQNHEGSLEVRVHEQVGAEVVEGPDELLHLGRLRFCKRSKRTPKPTGMVRGGCADVRGICACVPCAYRIVLEGLSRWRPSRSLRGGRSCPWRAWALRTSPGP